MGPNDQPRFNKDADSEDSIESFKKNLYSRNNYFGAQGDDRAGFNPHDVHDVPKNWGEGGMMNNIRALQNPAHRMSLLKKLLIIALCFFGISVSIALYVLLGGANVISSSNVDISINGPVSVPGGELLPLEISVKNQNNADLETADLVIDYPEGTRQAVDSSIALKRFRESFGTVGKGKVAVKKVQAVLFGESGSVKTVSVSVEYRLKGSNALFSKKKEYSVSISSAPVTVTVDSVNEINANQEAEFVVSVVSNSTSVIQNMAVSAEYPFGFTFSNSDPAPSWSNSFWQLGDLKPGVKRVIKIRGKVAGQDNEDRVFRFSAGTENPTNENAIGTAFLTTVRKVTLRKPFVGTTIALDGDSADTHISKPGKTIRADVSLSNNVGVKMTDVKVEVKVSGSALDMDSISSSGGYYRSSDRTIIYDQTLLPRLAVLNPDEDTNVSFSFAALPELYIRSVKSPQITVNVKVTGQRVNEAGVPAEVTSIATRTIKLSSSLGLSARVLYYSGPFSNKGPIPPKVNTETTYTVVWSLTSGTGDISNVKVSAILPSYMKWLGVVSPQTENVSYSQVGGQIVWDAGDLPANTGYSGSPKEISFQVSFVPSLTQVGSAPTVINDVTATGDDSFVDQTLQVTTSNPITTNLTTDIGFKQGQGTVVK